MLQMYERRTSKRRRKPTARAASRNNRNQHDDRRPDQFLPRGPGDLVHFRFDGDEKIGESGKVDQPVGDPPARCQQNARNAEVQPQVQAVATRPRPTALTLRANVLNRGTCPWPADSCAANVTCRGNSALAALDRPPQQFVTLGVTEAHVSASRITAGPATTPSLCYLTRPT